MGEGLGAPEPLAKWSTRHARALMRLEAVCAGLMLGGGVMTVAELGLVMVAAELVGVGFAGFVAMMVLRGLGGVGKEA